MGELIRSVMVLQSTSLVVLKNQLFYDAKKYEGVPPKKVVFEEISQRSFFLRDKISSVFFYHYEKNLFGKASQYFG